MRVRARERGHAARDRTTAEPPPPRAGNQPVGHGPAALLEEPVRRDDARPGTSAWTRPGLAARGGYERRDPRKIRQDEESGLGPICAWHGISASAPMTPQAGRRERPGADGVKGAPQPLRAG